MALKVQISPRPWSWWTVRARLGLLVALPVLGMLAFAVAQAGTVLGVADGGQRTRDLASLATATSGLVHQLEREQAESQALAARGGTSGRVLVTAARQRTDAARRAFSATGGTAQEAAPGLTPALRAAEQALTRARQAAQEGTGQGDANGTDRYGAAVTALLTVATALPRQIDDQRLANQAHAVAELAGAKHALAEQRELLRGALTRRRLRPAEARELVRLAATEAAHLRAFEAAADPWARGRLTSRLVGPDVEATRATRAAMERTLGATQAAAARPDPATGRTPITDADAWYVAASHTIRRLHDVELDLTGRLDTAAAEVLADARRGLVATIGLTAGALAGTLAVTALVAADLARRLRRLRASALALADVHLPEAIKAIGAAPDPVAARTDQLARHALGEQHGPDEIGDVGSALSVVHARALDLATGQTLLRRESAAVFEAMARRGQTLVARQLDLIDRLEAGETDPDTLGWLYQLDHLAARMRRNDESLLVLAGGEPVRQFGTAVPLYDVVRGALAEIEEYRRIQPIALTGTPVAAEAVGDLVHLIAELLENATHHSPPDTPVVVRAYISGDGCTVTIQDQGSGMDPVALDQANTRLARPDDPVAGLGGTMGLRVVARLADRHGVTVRLSSRGRGVIATVLIPPPLLASAPRHAGTGPAPVGAGGRDGGGAPGIRETVAAHGPSGTRAAGTAAEPETGMLADRLGWLLTRFTNQVPGVAHAVAVSADGVALASSGALSRERSVHLAAAVAGIAGLSAGTARSLATGQVRQTAVDMDEGALLTFAAGRVLLGVLTRGDTDYGDVAYEAGRLGLQVADLLGAADEPVPGPATDPGPLGTADVAADGGAGPWHDETHPSSRT
ncbi:nitrate- and nitrite sensing domain-containing protein [Nonomuraea indica]|uniref:nitrate- and nitrite sensing domain-containing protein n=1 Tax=Nonomuraea indica TaxID=1581193 RepID=UPI000C798EC5|nr:nitrate- and nitrite sensing domain-containing protein [Nonomuraea indica]